MLRIKLLKFLDRKIDDVCDILKKSNIEYLSEILDNPRKMLLKNFFSGIARGVGIAIGFTIIGGVIVFLLQKIILLNIPIMGDYLKDIADIIREKI